MAARFGAAPLPPLVVDHIDGDPANNTLANLRPATRRLNGLNSRRHQIGCLDQGKWRVRAGIGDGRTRYLGRFSDRESAKAAYLRWHEQAIEEEVAVSWAAYMAQLEGSQHGR